jgi:7-cyano-7-deazaguanine synthase
MKAVCLISGGLDSCVSAAIAREQGYQLYGLTIDYGQRNKKEVDCARHIAEALEVVEHKVIKADLRTFGQSALTDDIEVPDGADWQGIPPTYVPARNTIFLSYGLAYTEAIAGDALFIGVNSVDYSGYPDCRPEYIKAFQRVAILGTKRGVEGNPIRIQAPVIDMSKEQIVARGAELGAPLQYTWSCYQGEEVACGRCASCRLRRHGFEKAGVPDPLAYKADHAD